MYIDPTGSTVELKSSKGQYAHYNVEFAREESIEILKRDDHIGFTVSLKRTEKVLDLKPYQSAVFLKAKERPRGKRDGKRITLNHLFLRQTNEPPAEQEILRFMRHGLKERLLRDGRLQNKA